MMHEVNPAETTRVYAFEMWMQAPMPMVTLFRTMDVTKLRRISRRRGLIFNNPFLIWGRYRSSWLKTYLTVSFQFHHTQMDGAHAARFLELLQQEIKELNW